MARRSGFSVTPATMQPMVLPARTDRHGHGGCGAHVGDEGVFDAVLAHGVQLRFGDGASAEERDGGIRVTMGGRQAELSSVAARPVAVVEKECDAITVDDLGHRPRHPGRHVFGAQDLGQRGRQIQQGSCRVGLMTGVLHGVGCVEGGGSQAGVGFESALRLRREDPAALVDGEHAVVATHRLDLDGYHSGPARTRKEILGDRGAFRFAQSL